ncbi:phosphomannomutase/phosphoglucomutase [Cognatiluteimonas profundi]|uniref:phosphomannomutase/phosphoglucomutase n=1 Tax=Cognatiluteimonas profundi TaxID=2594501 RepID=UPI001E591485|nr:phosphomannomutase/phosphoglucomutase [Lysobacter profundi]
MTDRTKPRLQLPMAQLRPALPVLAAVLVLLALWVAWGGWQQMQDASLSQSLQASRDLVATGTQRELQQQTDRLRLKLASPDVQIALAAGDLGKAANLIKTGWPHIEEALILPADLDAAYGTLPQGGFGRLAAAEAALVAKGPVARIGKDGGAKLLLAAPAKAGERLVGVAYVRLPLSLATDALQSANVESSSYLALREGNYTVLERGDPTLSNVAEAMAVKVPGSDLRIAAGLPDTTSGAFGLGALASFIAAAVLLGLGVLAWLAHRRGFGMGHGAFAAADDNEPTLAQAMQQAPVMPRPVAEARAVEEPAKTAVRIDRGIFRAYDIRGIVGQSLDAGVAELIGHAVGTLMFEKGLNDIVVGRDGRLSGPDLVAGLTEGLRKAGRNVIDIGMAPSPVVYFGSFQLRTGCCIAVTGSHNPPDYNGFKIVVGGDTLSGDAILDLHARIAEDRLHVAASPGSLAHRDIGEEYVARIAGDVQIDRRLKIVVDAGNGVAGVLGPRVLEAIGADVTPLYCEIDGNFPNHHPDPSEPKNLVDLVQMVQRLDADLGIAFDGDGDRLGVVTRDGETIYPDRLLMLFAADVLERNPGAVIVYDVKCTGRLPGHILRHGGSPLMWKTGHSLIKAKMRETEAELAGEMSGHFFFAERWYGFDDGIYAAARLLEILAARPESATEQLNALPNGVSTPEIKVDAPDGDPHSFVERFRAAARFEGGRSSTIDGLRVDWPDGWGLVRASNTTPVLVLRFDADSQAALVRIQSAFREQLLALKPDLVLPF